MIRRRQLQTRRRVLHSDAIVETPRPVLAQDQILRSGRLGEKLHRHVQVVSIGRPPAEIVFAGVRASEPRSRYEVRRVLFVGDEVLVERQQDKRILLGVLPSSFSAMAQQSANQLRDQIIGGLISNQRLEYYSINSPVRVQEEVSAVAVRSHEMGCGGLFGDPIIQKPSNR